MSRGDDREPFERPFQKSLEPLTEDVSIKINYPSEDEMFGLVSMGWRVHGKIWESMFKIHALRVLAGYMSSSAIRSASTCYYQIYLRLKYRINFSAVRNSQVENTKLKQTLRGRIINIRK
jgi:hypothetical protein